MTALLPVGMEERGGGGGGRRGRGRQAVGAARTAISRTAASLFRVEWQGEKSVSAFSHQGGRKTDCCARRISPAASACAGWPREIGRRRAHLPLQLRERRRDREFGQVQPSRALPPHLTAATVLFHPFFDGPARPSPLGHSAPHDTKPLAGRRRRSHTGRVGSPSSPRRRLSLPPPVFITARPLPRLLPALNHLLLHPVHHPSLAFAASPRHASCSHSLEVGTVAGTGSNLVGLCRHLPHRLRC